MDFDADKAALASVIADAFVQTGKPLSVAEIAAAVKWPESKIRRILSANSGVPGVEEEREQRPSYSKNYHWMQAGWHAVKVYSPTKQALAALLREQKKGDENG